MHRAEIEGRLIKQKAVVTGRHTHYFSDIEDELGGVVQVSLREKFERGARLLVKGRLVSSERGRLWIVDEQVARVGLDMKGRG